MRIAKVLALTSISVCAFIATPSANARWLIDGGPSATVSRMDSEGLLQTRSDIYFTVDVAQVNSTPQAAGQTAGPAAIEKYAVVVDGVVDKIINWDGFSENEDLNPEAVIIKMPENDGVKFVNSYGDIILAPIYQGSIVSELIAPDVKVTPEVGLVQVIEIVAPAEPVGPPVVNASAPVVVAQEVAPNNSINMTIEVKTSEIPANSTVSIQVVTDGRSTTSIGVDPTVPVSQVVVRDLPQNENVTVKTIITNVDTNKETVIIIPVVATIPAPVVIPESARNAAQDLATIAKPYVISSSMEASGHRAVEIKTPVIPNYDTSKTIASLMLVGYGGATTAIGLSGNGEILTVGSMGPAWNYTLKVVIRDIGSGKETFIMGDPIIKLVEAVAVPESARDAAQDLATIAKPFVISSRLDETGHRVVEIKTPVIPNYDTSKTTASLMVVGPGGSTTSIGLYGNGETLTVGTLGPDFTYTVKIVLRDLGSAKETFIFGDPITKG